MLAAPRCLAVNLLLLSMPIARSVAISPTIVNRAWVPVVRAVPTAAPITLPALAPAVSSPARAIQAWSAGASAHDVTYAGAVTNVALSGLKAAVGVATGSASLIADAGHSLSDLASDALALCAASVPKLERSCTRCIAVLLGFTGLTMVYHSGVGLLAHLLPGVRPAAAAALGVVPPASAAAAASGAATGLLDAAALCIALVSVASKEVLYRVTHAVGKRCGSSTLVANALHHRSDAMSSIAAAFGICGALAGFRALDSLAALVVGGMVVRLGIETAQGEHGHHH